MEHDLYDDAVAVHCVNLFHPAAHLAVLEHAEAHGVLAEPHEAAGAVDGVQHPVAASGAAF